MKMRIDIDYIAGYLVFLDKHINGLRDNTQTIKLKTQELNRSWQDSLYYSVLDAINNIDKSLTKTAELLEEKKVIMRRLYDKLEQYYGGGKINL